MGGSLDAAACENKSVLLKAGVPFNDYKKLERRLVESWAIQALGTTRRKACGPCSEGKGIYKDCRTVKGLLDGVCGNCKRRERCGECNHSEVWKEGLRESLAVERIARKSEKKKVTQRGETANGRYKMRDVTRPRVYGQ